MTEFEDLRARAEAGDVRAQVALGNLCQGLALELPPKLFSGLNIHPKRPQRSWGERLQTADVFVSHICPRTGEDRWRGELRKLSADEFAQLWSGERKDERQAVTWFRRAADQGDVWGQVALGSLYYRGVGVAQDGREAEVWFRRACERASTMSALDRFRIARMFAWGHGLPQDFAESMRWYRAAVDAAGSEFDADPSLRGMSFDWVRAVGRAEHGEAEAQFTIGEMFDVGRPARRGEWTGAAHRGTSFLRHFPENPVPENATEATKWYRLAAQQGHAGAQIYLGSIYRAGSRGVERDDREAERWFRLAAEQAHRDGQYLLGDMLENGLGCDQDYAEARRYYELAAEQGKASALSALAHIYSAGLGVPQDLVLAEKYSSRVFDAELMEHFGNDPKKEFFGRVSLLLSLLLSLLFAGLALVVLVIVGLMWIVSELFLS